MTEQTRPLHDQLADTTDSRSNEQAGARFFDGRSATREELIRENAELTKINEELEAFVSNAAHDLQEPLRAVRVYSQLVLELGHFTNASEPRQHLEIICSAAAGAQALIENLLLYARLTSIGLQNLQRIDLKQLLSRVLSVISPRLQECAATMQFTLLPMVWGEEPELMRLFINLLTNALKYRREGIQPHIEIVAEERGDEFVIAIRDNGIGFDPLDAVEIFKPFKRLNHDVAPGTGLGLAIAKAIVERHGGRIWAASDGVAGATVSFTLHRADEQERCLKAHA